MVALLIVTFQASPPVDLDVERAELAAMLSASGAQVSSGQGASNDAVHEADDRSVVFEYGNVEAAQAAFAVAGSRPFVDHVIIVPQTATPSRPPVRLARLALLVWIAVYVLLNVLLIVTAPVLGAAPLLVRTFVATAILVPIVVVKVIPFANQRFGRWLSG